MLSVRLSQQSSELGPPPPHPQGSVAPCCASPLSVRERHTCLRGAGPNSDEGKDTTCCDIELWTFYLLLWNYLRILKIFPVTLWLWSGNFYPENEEPSYGKPPGTNTSLRWFFLHPMRGWTLNKLTNEREGSRYRNFDATSGTILGISTESS